MTLATAERATYNRSVVSGARNNAVASFGRLAVTLRRCRLM